MYAKRQPPCTVCRASRLKLALLLSAASANFGLGATEISDMPVVTTSVLAKPNIMLLMDASKSMRFTHAPDQLEGAGLPAPQPIGYRASQCNSIYYNPTKTYRLPLDASGAALPMPGFDAAPYDYYSSDGSRVNLNNAFRAFDHNTRARTSIDADDIAQRAYYYVYTGSADLSGPTAYAAAPCSDPYGDVDHPDGALLTNSYGTTATTGGSWTRVQVGNPFAPDYVPGVREVNGLKQDERQNFAIWYTYYRTRIALTKSGIGRAFNPIGDRYRVGFITANPLSKSDPEAQPATDASVDPAYYLPLGTFVDGPSNAQKSNWYSKLYSQVPGGSSPMREGLARVGRHYANKYDYINKGMTPYDGNYPGTSYVEPESERNRTCRQNFTIMTTDGVWNRKAETRGPVKLDGLTLVGQQDGTWTPDSGNTPYPIWDGGARGTQITTAKSNLYAAADCATGLVSKSTTQDLVSTSVLKQSTAQLTKTTSQLQRSTDQMTKHTVQQTQSTTQPQRRTSQTKMRTTAITRSTSQLNQTVTQITSNTTTPTQWTSQLNITTTFTEKSTSQLTQSTSQLQQSTSQLNISTSAVTTSTRQVTQSSSQLFKSVVQHNLSTAQILRSTRQVQKVTAQSIATRSRIFAFDGETLYLVASCINTNLITCYPEAPTVTPVDLGTCIDEAASASNGYTKTVCTSNNTGPTPVEPEHGCRAHAAVRGNDFLETTCPQTVTGPTPVASCSAADARQENAWTQTTCDTITTGPTPVLSCVSAVASAGNAYVATTCTDVGSGPAPAPSCTAAAADAGNAFTSTVCNNVTTGPTGVANCTPSGSAAVAPYLVVTCNTVATGPTPVASCNAVVAASSNNYTETTCNTTSTGPTPTLACNPAAAAAGNGFVTTTCPMNSTGPTPVASCTPAAAVAGNSYTATVCNTVTTGPTGVANCTPSGSPAIAPYFVTSCNNVVTGPAPAVACVNAAAMAANAYTTTTCNVATVGPTPTGSCTPAAAGPGNGYVATSCNTVTTPPVTVGSCTPVAADASNNWTATLCGTSSTGPVGAPLCVPGPGVVCNTVVTTTPVAVCTPQGAAASNNWQEITCSTLTTGPNNVEQCIPVKWDAFGLANGYSPTFIYNTWTGPGRPYASQYDPQPGTATYPGAGWYVQNNYTRTICATATSAYTYVASCTPAAASAVNGYVATECVPANTGPDGVQAGTCVPQTAIAGNDYLTVSCNTVNTGPTGVSVCNPQTGNAANGWIDINCNQVVTDNPVLSAGGVFSCSPAAAVVGNNWTATTCVPTVLTSLVPSASCVAQDASVANSYTRTTCGTASSAATPVAPGACSPEAAAPGNSYTTTSCNTVTTGPTAVSSCSNTVAAAGNAYTETTCQTVTTGPLPSANCVASGSPNVAPYLVTSCSTATSGPTVVSAADCVNQAKAAGNNQTATSCVPVPGKKVQYSTTTTTTTTTLTGDPTKDASVVTASSDLPHDLDGMCYSATQQPALFASSPAWSASGNPPTIPLAVPTALAAVPDFTPPAFPCTGSSCTVVTESAYGGSANSLADVAQYYYVTDLRPDLVDDRSVFKGTGPEDDRVKWQHMTTYALGLGVSGTLKFHTEYLNGLGDFAALRRGEKMWPIWPTADADTEAKLNDPRSIDDVWHSAVNGRGQFFSARDPDSLVDGIKGALDSIDSVSGAGSGASSATQTPDLVDNAIFTTEYVTSQWSGDVRGKHFLLSEVAANGIWTPTASSVDWSADTLLAQQAVFSSCDNRNIRLIRFGVTNNLAPFTWDSKVCDSAGLPAGPADTGLNEAEKAYFGAGAVAQLSQFDPTGPSTDQQRSAAAGANLVNYLRGQSALAGYLAGEVTKLYRSRKGHVLGDIVNSQLLYVKAPSLNYADTGYADPGSGFKATHAGRPSMVYVGANDGMLHAFYAPKSTDANWADRGKEAWAVIPSTVLPNMARLADVALGSHHQYFVDGSPVSGDVHVGGSWKTILVGGLNKGGRAYYALDITDPATPKALWEFKAASSGCAATSADAVGNSSDCNLGLSFGQPVITKMANGTWVVLVTSGYNNTAPGDGQGYLYVLDAGTGRIVKRIGTGAGDNDAPGGLRELTTYVSNVQMDNTALRVYGGDLLGNVWRFDINDGTAVRVTTLNSEARAEIPAVAASGSEPARPAVPAQASAPQPITTRIALAEVNGLTHLMVGTGRLLGVSDTTDQQQQTVYNFIDPLLVPASAGDAVLDPATLRASLKPVSMVTTGSSDDASLQRHGGACAGTAAQCASAAGWYLNLPQSGERLTVDMALGLGTLVFQTNVPDTNQCSPGYSLTNYIDFVRGEAVAPGSLMTEFGGKSLASGASLLVIGGHLKWIVTNADGSVRVFSPPASLQPPLGKRISWREISG